MRIVVNHLTRMQPGYICVAGIDPQTGKHVRPVLNGRLSRDLLATRGGPFDMAAWVDLGPTIYAGTPPEIEDYAFTHHVACAAAVASPTDFWSLLQGVAHRRLVDIFGPDLQPNGSGCTLSLGKGLASLGCLIPAGRPELHVHDDTKVRLRFSDSVQEVSLSITDLRFYQGDRWTLKRATVADVQRRLRDGVPVVLSVGLTRPWQKEGDVEKRHWLQVNGIHLADHPVWQVG
jgi:hypothetical protein